MDTNEKVKKARSFIKYLLNGVKAFYPKLFDLTSPREDNYDGYEIQDFTNEVLEITQETKIADAKTKLEYWLTDEITQTVPQEIIDQAENIKEHVPEKNKEIRKRLTPRVKPPETPGVDIDKTTKGDKPGEVLKLVFKPGRQSNISFLAKPVNALVGFFARQGLSYTNKNGSTTAPTAALIMANGGSWEELEKVVGRVRFNLSNSQARLLDKLVSDLKTAQSSPPPIYKFLAEAKKANISISQSTTYQLTHTPKRNEIYLQKAGNNLVATQNSISPPGIFNTIARETFGRLFGKVVGKATKKIATSLAEKAAAGAVETGVATATEAGALGIGTATGPGLILVVAAIVAKKLLNFAKKILSKIMIALKGSDSNKFQLGSATGLVFGGLALIGSGFGLIGSLMTGAGGAWFLGKGLANVKGLAKSGSSFINTATYGITNVAGPAIGIPTIIAIISIPLAVMFIIFIINTSAFVVPEGLTGFNSGFEETPSFPSGGSGIGYDPGTPAEQICLPTSGQITQLAFCESSSYVNNASHCFVPGENAFDIANEVGTPIYAVHNGTATSYYDSKFYGHYIIIEGVNLKTRYAHMLRNETIPVGTSTEVKKGDLIGRINNSGNSSGNHVHFDLLQPRVHIRTIFGAPKHGQFISNCFSK